MTWIGRDCDTCDQSQRFKKSKANQNLWPELEGIVTLSPFDPRGVGSSNQNLWPELEGIVTDRQGRRRGPRRCNQNLWPELEGIVTYIAWPGQVRPGQESEFMTWIGRDCDAAVESSYTPIESGIRIYDLNWKGLWRSWAVRECTPQGCNQNLWPELEGIVTIAGYPPLTPGGWGIRIYDLNWKGLWLFGVFHCFFLLLKKSEFMTWIGRDCDNPMPIDPCHSSRKSEFMTWIGRDCDSNISCCILDISSNQNLWPELEGIVTRAQGYTEDDLHQSEFMTWIGRDCDPRGPFRKFS